MPRCRTEPLVPEQVVPVRVRREAGQHGQAELREIVRPDRPARRRGSRGRRPGRRSRPAPRRCWSRTTRSGGPARPPRPGSARGRLPRDGVPDGAARRGNGRHARKRRPGRVRPVGTAMRGCGPDGRPRQPRVRRAAWAAPGPVPGTGPGPAVPERVRALRGPARCPDPRDWADLQDLLAGDPGAVMVRDLDELPPSITPVRSFVAVQMVDDDGAGPEPSSSSEVVTLTAADVPDMLQLVRRTEPGPFAQRTAELGAYFGIRRDGVLLAMAGQRLRPPGWTELSAVCTDPAARGQGLAGQVIAAVAQEARQRGDRVFLHILATNSGALQLSRRLGYRERGPSRSRSWATSPDRSGRGPGCSESFPPGRYRTNAGRVSAMTPAPRDGGQAAADRAHGRRGRSATTPARKLPTCGKAAPHDELARADPAAQGVRRGELHDRRPEHDGQPRRRHRRRRAAPARAAGRARRRNRPGPRPRPRRLTSMARPGRTARRTGPDSTEPSRPPTATPVLSRPRVRGEPPNRSALMAGKSATGMASTVALRSASSAPRSDPVVAR